jgi:hypothetical protein
MKAKRKTDNQMTWHNHSNILSELSRFAADRYPTSNKLPRQRIRLKAADNIYLFTPKYFLLKTLTLVSNASIPIYFFFYGLVRNRAYIVCLYVLICSVWWPAKINSSKLSPLSLRCIYRMLFPFQFSTIHWTVILLLKVY